MTTHPEILDVLEGRRRWTVITADCLDVLPTLPDGCVDAVISDPPYGVAFRGCAWDASIPPWIEPARSVSKIVAFTTGITTMWDYPRADWVCCWYREASNSRSKLGGFSHWSPILVYGQPEFPIDSIKLHAIQHAQPSGFAHPSPKPEKLMRWLVERCVSLDGIVLDPFTGSGTTGVACMQTGRRFIGIEIDPHYAEIARRRIAEADTHLFKEARP